VGVSDVDATTYAKEVIAITVVVIDLLIGLYFWISILIVRPIEVIVTREIQEGNMDPSDFTVQVKQVPYRDNLLALPGIYYAWAENILEKS
jgi:hypothetical protein